MPRVDEKSPTYNYTVQLRYPGDDKTTNQTFNGYHTLDTDDYEDNCGFLFLTRYVFKPISQDGSRPVCRSYNQSLFQAVEAEQHSFRLDYVISWHSVMVDGDTDSSDDKRPEQ